MELIIYTRICLPCKMGRQLRIVRQFAKYNGYKLSIKRVFSQDELPADTETPFVWFKKEKQSLALSTITLDSEGKLATKN